MVVQASVSQSVERAVRVLAVFEAERRPLGRAEICDVLQAPRSSMAALLQAMTELGLLSADRSSQTYFPTARLGRLAGWIDRVFSVEEPVARLLKRAQAETRETVTLTTPLHNIMEVVHVEPGLNAVAYVAAVGQAIPMWGSAVGNAYFSTLSDRQIADLHRRARPPSGGKAAVPALATIMDGVERTRASGYSMVVGTISSDAAALAMPLPAQDAGRKALVIALSGPSDRIGRDEPALVRTLSAEISDLRAAQMTSRGA